MTMNDHWGYNKHDHNWKSTNTLIRNLIDCASKGGNYLLNVGPTAEGVIPDASIERLAIGAVDEGQRRLHLRHQGRPVRQAIALGPLHAPKLTAATTTLYLHVFDWPADGELLVPGLQNHIQTAWLLADPKKKKFAARNGQDGVTLSLPLAVPDAISSTIVLQIRGAPVVE